MTYVICDAKGKLQQESHEWSLVDHCGQTKLMYRGGRTDNVWLDFWGPDAYDVQNACIWGNKLLSWLTSVALLDDNYTESDSETK